MRKSMHRSRLRRMLTDHFDRESCNVLSEGKGEKAASRRSSVYYSRTMFLYPCHDGGRRKKGEREGVLPCFVIYGCITESGARMVNA